MLKARITDTNKAVQLLALDVVARIATGMGKPFEKHTRFFALPISTVLSDQKANIRQAGVTTLNAIAEACEGVESMVQGVGTGLESANPLQRSTLLTWIAEWFKEHERTGPLDLGPWVTSVVAYLDDRNTDVRKAAQAALPFIVAQAGVDQVMQQTNSLKPASRNTAIPLIKAAAGSVQAAAAPAPAPTKAAKAAPPAKASPPVKAATPVSSSPPPPPSPTTAASSATSAPASKLTGVRRKLPQGSIPRPESRAATSEDAPPAPVSRLAKPGMSGLKRPTSIMTARTATPVAQTPAPSATSPFVTANLEAKKSRLARDNTRWVIESGPTRKDLVDLLQTQVEPHASKELFSLLFSRDHNAINDYVAGLGVLCDFYSSLALGDDKYGFTGQDRYDIGIANADLALKYVSIRVHEPQPNLISKCLDTVDNVMSFFRDVNYQLSDAEGLCFIPTIINKVSQLPFVLVHSSKFVSIAR